MRKILLSLLLIQSVFSFSQDVITTKGTKVYNSNNQKLSGKEVRSLLSTNTEAVKLYNLGKSKQLFGNVILASGFAMVAGKLVFGKKPKNNITYTQYGPIYSFEPTNNYLYYIGAGLMITSIPILIGHTKKIKKSIDLINDDLKNPSIGYNIESNLILNQDGLGISIRL